MTRLAARFAVDREDAALVCYLMAGDPSLDDTREIVLALADEGVDAIELGVPFSDPLADGPSIQAAGMRALEAGARVPDVLGVVRGIRAASQVPIVLMTYYNPALRHGLERFANDAAEAGVDAVIQTDLSPEEAEPWVAEARRAGLDTVFLLAPTSTSERIRVVCGLATGFIYCVSRTGVTGAQSDVPADLPDLIRRVRAEANAPVCVGFGVSSPEQVRRIVSFADGVVVGSALVDIIAAQADAAARLGAVCAFARNLKAATLRQP
ncbi:MAG: tryptophan synthase subunit alpha [Chthonomonadales bacterium]|nr:tryptophan synthase subunit alpha [Chthonomonadales bacterium]